VGAFSRPRRRGDGDLHESFQSILSGDNLQLHSDKLVSVESSKESSCLHWSHSTRNDIQLSARKEVGRCVVSTVWLGAVHIKVTASEAVAVRADFPVWADV
jgi:hypothetical protein